MPLVNIFESCFNIINKPREYTELENYQGPLAKAWGLRDEQIEPDSQALSQFYGKYASKRCFIIGNGPSLNKHDLKLLTNEYTFGVNSLFYKSNETGFMPTFYVVEDSSVLKENINEIKKYSPPLKFFPSVYRNYHPSADNVFFFKMNRGFYEKRSPNFSIPRFSTDITREVYCGQSVTYMNFSWPSTWGSLRFILLEWILVT